MVQLEEFIQSTDFQSMAQVNLDAGCPSDVAPGSICYLRSWMPYGSRMKARPSVPYVLISNYQDHCVEGAHAEAVLNDPLCLRWFSVNAVMYHPKLTPIPFGLRAVKPLLNVEQKPKDIFCYANFRVHSPARLAAWEWASAQPWVTKEVYDKHHQHGFLASVARSHFVLCPEGHGPDTFRLWEVLALGAVPVVCGRRLSSLCYQLPVVQVDRWADLHAPLLQWIDDGIENCLTRRLYRLEKLRRTYWQREILWTSQSG